MRLLRENKILNKSVLAESIQEKRLNLIQKQLEKYFQESSLKISIYEFRETIDRYIGLTLANQSHSEKISLTEKEIFRISENKNIELAAICLSRRNQKRLSFHQKGARQDFLYIINKLLEFSQRKEVINNLVIEFVKTLNDLVARNELEKMFTKTSQTDKYFAVKQLEKDLWNTEIHKPSPTNSITTRFRTMTATTNLRGKD